MTARKKCSLPSSPPPRCNDDDWSPTDVLHPAPPLARRADEEDVSIDFSLKKKKVSASPPQCPIAHAAACCHGDCCKRCSKALPADELLGACGSRSQKKKPKAGEEEEEEEEEKKPVKAAVEDKKPAAAAAEEEEDESLDFSKIKKKKKKPKDGEEEGGDGPTPPPPAPSAAAADDDDDESLDFSKIPKKKKKPKEDEAAAAAPAPADEDEDEVLDFSKSKKKPKKPKEDEGADDKAEKAEGATGAAEGDDGEGEDDDDGDGVGFGQADDDDDDDDDDDGDDDGEDEGGEGGFISIPADREYKYEELLDRMYSLLHANNPELAGDRKRFLIKPPQVVREGSKRVVLTNFGEICKTLNRSMDHVYSFMLAEMGTTGSIDASSRMVIKGRFPPKAIEQIIRRYVGEYVSCSSCKSPATALQKQNRLYFMQCNNCGARRSVTPIKTGFVAISRGARKKNRAV